MYHPVAVAALAMVSLPFATSQLMDLDAIAAAPDPVLVTPPDNVVQNTPPDVPAPPIVPITTEAASPTDAPSKVKRSLALAKRDGNCSLQPKGSGPVPTPDTVDAFEVFPTFAAMAFNAPTPDGYALVFNNLDGSMTASNYMGLYTLTSYDTLGCASKCNRAAGCEAFNMYIERDPTLDSNQTNCPNPPSTTNYKCTLWGAPLSQEEATNVGQYRDSFHVVIAGSNAYNKDAPPPAVSGYNGPTELGGAINAPTSSGSYMGYHFYPFSQAQGYDPQTCANACNAQTAYDSRHPATNGAYMSCTFFNAYVLSQNGLPQGLYCSMYNQTWAPSYATNYGQYRGTDRYTVSRSYTYSLG